MKKTIKVKGITLGEGTPKICVPMVGRTTSQLIEEARLHKTLDLDLVEWRVDHFEQVDDLMQVKEALANIRSVLTDIPLIFTFRSTKEGGEKEISNDHYIELNKEILQTGQVDFIDVELFNEEKDVKTLINFAHSHDVFVIVSNHDFEKTPPKEEIVSRLRSAQDLGGDIPKIAVMPKTNEDVLALLDATNIMYEKYADRPIITISMGQKGAISRVAGFGSALTFGAAKVGSAPGQIAVNELRSMLNLLNQ
ncbi:MULTISPECIES: type I 3-dehydroquinate dehydratase [Neobacillus]|uniref:3-dehydroquinate dehydratase n=1 Tax=Neobacillus rhizophilus TaxID=2833579 RepID=A0A942U6D9_9BACI|nr:MULTISPECIES: type I 3-dehydroquinate dehydratase [Neobacillus]MBS4213503.1 type I 3-dehydroquinate dehydratase [Neobacillus rhizophilus]